MNFWSLSLNKSLRGIDAVVLGLLQPRRHWTAEGRSQKVPEHDFGALPVIGAARRWFCLTRKVRISNLCPNGTVVQLLAFTRRAVAPITCMWKHDVIHRIGSTWVAWHIATSSEEDRATAATDMCKEFGEVWPCGFRDIRADRQDINLQTYKHAHHNTSQLCWGPPFGGEVNNFVK